MSSNQDKIRTQIIERNLGLQKKLQQKYSSKYNQYDCYEDLINEQVFGIIRQIELFDNSKGYKFSTYCYYWICHKLERYIYEKRNIVKMPIKVKNIIGMINKQLQILTQIKGEQASLNDLQIEIDIDRKKLELFFNQDFIGVSLDNLVKDESDKNRNRKTFQEFLVQLEEVFFDDCQKELIM